MKAFNQALLAALMGSALVAACGQKEEPKVEIAVPDAAPAPAPEVKKEPVKEEPGGWEPPPELRVPGTTIPVEGTTAPATTETVAPAAETAPAPAATEKPAK